MAGGVLERMKRGLRRRARRWLLAILQDDAAEAAPGSPPSGEVSGGPPAHWVELVKDRAPQLLRPADSRSGIRMPGLRPVIRQPEEAKPRVPVPDIAAEPAKITAHVPKSGFAVPTTPISAPTYRGKSSTANSGSPPQPAKSELREQRTEAGQKQSEILARPAVAAPAAVEPTRQRTTIAYRHSGQVRQSTHRPDVAPNPATAPRDSLLKQPERGREQAPTSSLEIVAQEERSQLEISEPSRTAWPELSDRLSNPRPVYPSHLGGETHPATEMPLSSLKASSPVVVEYPAREERRVTPRPAAAERMEDPWPELPDDINQADQPWEVQHTETEHLKRIELEQQGRREWNE